MDSNLTNDAAIQMLKTQLNSGMDLLADTPIDKDELNAWQAVTENYLRSVYGNSSPEISKVFPHQMLAIPGSAGPDWWADLYKKRLKTATTILNGLIDQLITKSEIISSSTPAENTETQNNDFSKVFIVHGRDDSEIDKIARFIQRFELEPIILREQPNKGRTIIEKFYDYSDVGFAIVLLTPDGRGGLATDDYESYQYRARQNVIFELGFFIGKLGRDKVCALFKEGVEIPSDYSGVVFIPMNGDWKSQLAQEMKAINPKIDLNKLART